MMSDILIPNRKFKQLINPHSHTDASLDGASTVKDIIKVNKELGATHVCVTEHGNMNSLMDLYTECDKAGIKPIMGIELYVVPPFIEEVKKEYQEYYAKSGMKQWQKEYERKIKNFYVHLTVHFKDYFAYQYFCKLTPTMEGRAVTVGGERKPIATLDEVAGAAGHITICSSCLGGAVQKWLVADRLTGQINLERARISYEMLRTIAGPDNFFVEIFPHQITHNWKRAVQKDGLIVAPGFFKPNECSPIAPNGDIQLYPNKVVHDFAKEYGDRCIISLDSHFAYPKNKLIQDMRLGNGEDQWKFYNSYHVMSTDEVAEDLKRNLGVDDRTIAEWVDNSYQWASLFNDYKMPTNKDRWVLPPINDNSFMQEVKRKIDFHGRMDWNDFKMVGQLKEEIDLYTKNGKINLMSYFFMLEDIAKFCKENDILINVRGSAGGALITYLFGISAINPQKHKLSLARFFSYGRMDSNELPDADIDISQAKREKVFEYLRNKYGDGFCQISMDAKLKLKSTIKDSERAILGSVNPNTEAMCKKLPTSGQGSDEFVFVFGKGDDEDHVPGIFDQSVELQQYALNNPTVWETVKLALGIQRQKSVHPCGCVIANEPIQNFVPLINVNGTWATGFGPKATEMAGLVKVDLLGLQTLSDIENALAEIKLRTGKIIDPWNLPYDIEVFKDLEAGRCETVFQFDTPTVLPLLMKTTPRSIDDLAKITALGRPGTLDAPSGVIVGDKELTLAELYVECANGRPVSHIHPDMESITGDTYGVQLFQEQTLEIFEKFATYIDKKTGEEKPYTKEQCEIARKGIGKKIKAILDFCIPDLRRGITRFGWTKDQVDLLISQIEASANYSFNKSHSVSYAYVAYACAYLKRYYKIYWWKGVLMNADRGEVTGKFWKYIKDFVILPDVNASTDHFEIIGEQLYAPLSMLNGIGPVAYEALVASKPYGSMEHFVQTHFSKDVKSKLHTGIAYKLICAGSLDSLYENPDIDLTEKLEYFELMKSKAKGKKKPDKVDSVYYSVTDLGKYLIKKEVVMVYSQDLRDLVLPPRDGTKLSSGHWHLNDEWPTFFSGKVVGKLQVMSVEGRGLKENISAVAYVVKEEALRYKKKTKQATKMILDIDGTFLEVVLWPGRDVDTAPMGFKKKIVLVQFNSSTNFFSIQRIEHILTPEQYNSYDVS